MVLAACLLAVGWCPAAELGNPAAVVGKKLWKVSLAVAGAAAAADAATSIGRHELNPALRGPGGTFGSRGIALKSAIVGSTLGVQYFLRLRSPKAYQIGAICNLGMAGVSAATAYHNTTVPKVR